MVLALDPAVGKDLFPRDMILIRGTSLSDTEHRRADRACFMGPAVPTLTTSAGPVTPVLGKNLLRLGRQGTVHGTDMILHEGQHGIHGCKTALEPYRPGLPALAHNARQRSFLYRHQWHTVPR